MRILLDTNVLARAAAGPPGLANQIVLMATRPEHVLLLSPFLVLELDRVLRYPRVRSTHGLADVEIQKYLTDLTAVAEMVVPHRPLASVVADDPQDDPIVAAAVAGRAAFLCTRDRHFSRAEVVAYCRVHNVEIVTDLELLARLDRTS